MRQWPCCGVRASLEFHRVEYSRLQLLSHSLALRFRFSLANKFAKNRLGGLLAPTLSSPGCDRDECRPTVRSCQGPPSVQPSLRKSTILILKACAATPPILVVKQGNRNCLRQIDAGVWEGPLANSDSPFSPAPEGERSAARAGRPVSRFSSLWPRTRPIHPIRPRDEKSMSGCLSAVTNGCQHGVVVAKSFVGLTFIPYERTFMHVCTMMGIAVR
mmetsp:Transcript_1585/g.4936  ORF Transcript_1585/g.4936 Transcript_1585/m.4936 type:complete len:216 (-) Transcript_1585:32-679(-)